MTLDHLMSEYLPVKRKELSWEEINFSVLDVIQTKHEVAGKLSVASDKLVKDINFTLMKATVSNILHNYIVQVVENQRIRPRPSIILHLSRDVMVKVRFTKLQNFLYVADRTNIKKFKKDPIKKRVQKRKCQISIKQITNKVSNVTHC